MSDHRNEPRPPRGHEQSEPSASEFFRAVSAIRDRRDLSGPKKAIMYAIASRMPNCFPSVEVMAEDAGLSESTVRKHLHELDAAGYIAIQVGGGPHGTNRYYLNHNKVDTVQEERESEARARADAQANFVPNFRGGEDEGKIPRNHGTEATQSLSAQQGFQSDESPKILAEETRDSLGDARGHHSSRASAIGPLDNDGRSGVVAVPERFDRELTPKKQTEEPNEETRRSNTSFAAARGDGNQGIPPRSQAFTAKSGVVGSREQRNTGEHGVANSIDSLPRVKNDSSLPPSAPTKRIPSSLEVVVAEECGWNLGQLTVGGHGALAKATKDIRDAAGENLSPDDIRQAAATYCSIFPRAELTPTALAKHWAKCTGRTTRLVGGHISDDFSDWETA